jgi:hypothetical protein
MLPAGAFDPRHWELILFRLENSRYEGRRRNLFVYRLTECGQPEKHRENQTQNKRSFFTIAFLPYIF